MGDSTIVVAPDRGSEITHPWEEEGWSSPIYTLPIEIPAEEYIGFSIPKEVGYSVALFLNSGSWRRVELKPSSVGSRGFLPSLRLGEIVAVAFFSKDPPEQLPVIYRSGEAPIHTPQGETRILGIETIDTPGGGYTVVGLESALERLESGVSRIRYRYKGESVGGTLRLSSSSESVDYDFNPRRGSGELNFYTGSLGFTPSSVSVDIPGFSVSSISFFPLPGERVGGTPVPLTAGLGTILHYPHSVWRDARYELFKWARFPKILILSTQSYEVQARFFKRLALFVEIRGSVGKILTDSEIENLSGWRANDFSSESLARFFTLAEELSVALTEEEYLLRDIAVNEEIIIPSGTGYTPGVGAVLDTSIESSYPLRALFMIHESVHGLFFTDSRFRQMVGRFMLTLSDEEREFWSLFLHHRSYNVREDHTLLANEVAAYLLQQPIEEVGDYLVGYNVPILLANYPDSEPWLLPMVLENPTLFEDSFQRIATSFETHVGFPPGRYYELLPKDRPAWKLFKGKRESWLSSHNPNYY